MKKTCNLAESSKLFKKFLKITVLVFIHQLAKFGGLLSSKDIFKNSWRHRFGKS